MKSAANNNDDTIVFSNESEAEPPITTEKWKILVVDDDYSVHTVTRMILGNFIYCRKGLEILSAYNDDEAYAAIRNNPDLALILLDVVMTKEDSGLRFVRFIR
mgnify:CR=1 FL=1